MFLHRVFAFANPFDSNGFYNMSLPLPVVDTTFVHSCLTRNEAIDNMRSIQKNSKTLTNLEDSIVYRKKIIKEIKQCFEWFCYVNRDSWLDNCDKFNSVDTMGEINNFNKSTIINLNTPILKKDFSIRKLLDYHVEQSTRRFLNVPEILSIPPEPHSYYVGRYPVLSQLIASFLYSYVKDPTFEERRLKKRKAENDAERKLSEIFTEVPYELYPYERYTGPGHISDESEDISDESGAESEEF